MPKLGEHHTEESKEKSRLSHLGRKYKKMSIIGRINISKARRGRKSYMWKGGITPIAFKIRNSIEFKLWRESVFYRDNFTCQKCNIRSGNGKHTYLNAHHINNFADYPDLVFVLDNGITFCKECHIKFHKIYGRKNNTRDKLIEFLTKLTELSELKNF